MTMLSPASPFHTNQLISTNGKRAERVDCSDLSKSIVDALTKICRMNKTESCGFITNTGGLYAIPNGHKEPRHNFFMEKEDVKEALHEIYTKRHEEIFAIWHTHPNGVPWPSPRDIRGWPNLLLGWRYLIATPSEVLEWKLK